MDKIAKLNAIIEHRLAVIKDCVKNGKINLDILSIINSILIKQYYDEYDLKVIATKLGNVLWPVYTEKRRGYPVTVDCDLSIEEMVDAGQYDVGAIDYFKQKFKVADEGKKSIIIHLLSFHGINTNDEIIQKVMSKNMRFVTKEEFLSFGAQHQDVQRVCNKVMTIITDDQEDSGYSALLLNGGPNHDDPNCQDRGLHEILCHAKWRRAYCFLVTSI